MRPTGPKPVAPHLSLVPEGGQDMRSCPKCGVSRTTTDGSCGVCHTERPPTGWARIMEKGAAPLDDDTQWIIEARLRPSGPVLRHRVRRELDGEHDTVGVFYVVNDSALFNAFEERAQALSKVRHATVQPPIRTGRHRGRPYRIDRLSTAPRLSTLLGTHTQSQVRQLVCQIGEGIAVLHRHGVVHGNVSLQRVAVVDEPDGPQAVLVETPAIAAGPWVPEAAPEVLRGMPADPRTDVFGLGLVFWALATGRDPRNESRATWADERPGPVLAVGEDLDLPDADRDLLRAMLDREPGVRPQDIAAVLNQLDGQITEPIARIPRPRPTATPPPPSHSEGRLIALAAVAVAIIGLSGLGLGVALWPGDEAPEHAPSALTDALPSGTAEPPPAPPEPVPAADPPSGQAADDAEALAAEQARIDADGGLPIPETPPTAAPEPQVDRRADRSPSKTAKTAKTAKKRAPAPEPEPAPAAAEPPPQAPPAADPPAADAAPEDPPAEAAPGSAGTAEPPDEPTASTPPEAPPEPEPPTVTADALAGSWSGVVNGRPATIQLFANPDGSLGGMASIRVGARPEQHSVVGRYRINDNGTISVSLIVKGTSTAWTGRVVDGRFAGAVLINGKERGDFAFNR